MMVSCRGGSALPGIAYPCQIPMAAPISTASWRAHGDRPSPSAHQVAASRTVTEANAKDRGLQPSPLPTWRKRKLSKDDAGHPPLRARRVPLSRCRLRISSTDKGNPCGSRQIPTGPENPHDDQEIPMSPRNPTGPRKSPEGDEIPKAVRNPHGAEKSRRRSENLHVGREILTALGKSSRGG